MCAVCVYLVVLYVCFDKILTLRDDNVAALHLFIMRAIIIATLHTFFDVLILLLLELLPHCTRLLMC